MHTHLIGTLVLLLAALNVEEDVPDLSSDAVRHALVHTIDHLLSVLGAWTEVFLLVFDHLGPLDAAQHLLLDLALLLLAAPSVWQAAIAAVDERQRLRGDARESWHKSLTV